MTYKLNDESGKHIAWVELEHEADMNHYFVSFPAFPGKVFIHDGYLTLRIVNPFEALNSRVFDIQNKPIAAEASGNVPKTSKETSLGEGGSSPTPSLQIPAEDIQKIINLFRQGEVQQQMPYMLRCAMHTAANVLEAYLKEGNATT